MIQTLRCALRWRGALIIVSVFGLLMASLVVGPLNQTASAVSCRVQVNPAKAGEVNGYSYTYNQVVPGWSGCNDINLQWASGYGGCWNFRVRFFPSGGGNWATEWKLFCPSGAVTPIATSVLNGTTYRIEWGGYIGYPTVQFTLID